MSDTLAAALPREMTRVAGLVPIYEAVPNGHLAASLMRASLARAQAAIDAWDVVAMLRAHADLQGYSL